jgi:Cupredoxin-like domain
VSQGAHVEANVTIAASGDVSPPAVSVPSGVGVELHVTNHGSGAATVAVSVPGHPSIHVAPGAKGTLESAGLKNGTYRILVNGTPRGQLMIGAQGGP